MVNKYSKIKLAIFITRFICGGAQKVVLDLLRHLSRDDYDLTLIHGHVSPDETTLLGELPDDIAVVKIDSVVREIDPIKDTRAFIELYRLLKKEKFDILHLHTSKAGILGSLAGCLSGGSKIVYTPHGHIFHKNAHIPGLSDSSDFKMKFLFRLRKYAYSRCDVLVSLSDVDKSEQVDLGLAPPDKFFSITNGIDLDYFNEIPVQDKLRVRDKFFLNDCKVIGYVGRLSKEKGLDILVQAFGIVHKSAPETKLLLLGDGDFKAELQRIAAESGVEADVIFAGNQGDVRPYLANFTVFTLPSRYESQGIAAMEAMAARVMVIASDVGGIPGILEHDRDGLLVEPESPTALAKAISDAIADDEMRDRLTAGATARANREFRKERMIADYDSLFKRVLEWGRTRE